MTYIYQLTGMICAGCAAKAKNTLLKLPKITAVEVSKEAESAIITIGKHFPTETMQATLSAVVQHTKNTKKEYLQMQRCNARSLLTISIFSFTKYTF